MGDNVYLVCENPDCKVGQQGYGEWRDESESDQCDECGESMSETFRERNDDEEV